MKNNISIIREEQRERFNVLTEEISNINKEIETRYKSLPTSNKKEWEIMVLNTVMPLHKKLHEKEEEYNFLKKELLEKKYANRICYSDVHPFEVIKEITQNKYLIREMNYELKNVKELRDSFVPGGFFGNTNNSLQKWDIKENENGITIHIRRHKDGYWYDSNGFKYYINNEPVQFHDFNF